MCPGLIQRLVSRLLPSRSRAPSEKASLPTQPTARSSESIDALLKDFARRYHSAPPYAAVGVAVPKGMTLRSFTAEALKRYPNLEACR